MLIINRIWYQNAHDPKSLFRLIDSLPNKKKSSPLPENIPEAVLAEEFSNFFMNKVNLIHHILNAMDKQHYQRHLIITSY